MAKGDHKRAQDMIYQQQGKSDNRQQKLDDTLYRQNDQFFNNYNRGTERNFGDYDQMMNMFNGFYQNPFNPQIPQGPQNIAPMMGGMMGNQNYGNLSDPNAWMGIASDPSKSAAWIKSNYPDLPDDVAQYYAGVIQGQPGANPTEQAGSAKYYLDMIREREYGGGNQYVGSKALGFGQGGGGGSFGGMFDPFGALGEAYGGYSDFAKTGGYSDDDIQNIRARAVSPIRSIYDRAQQGLNRQRRLGGGFSPNYTAATTKMAREMSHQIGDMNENIEGDIASMRNSGRLAGLGGLSGLGQFGSQFGLQSDIAKSNARLGGLNAMAGLYGTTPGMSSMFGNQTLNSSNQLLNSAGQANQMGQSTVGNMINSSNIPGNFQSAMNNVNAAISPISQVAGAFMPFAGGGNLFSGGKPSGGGSPYGATGWTPADGPRGMNGNPYGWSA